MGFFEHSGTYITPDLKRMRKLGISVVLPISAIITILPILLLILYFTDKNNYYEENPLWGVKDLYFMLTFSFSYFLIFPIGYIIISLSITWFKVRRSNLLHTIVAQVNNGKGVDRSYYNPSKASRDYFYKADQEQLEMYTLIQPAFLVICIVVTLIPLAWFLIDAFSNNITRFDGYLLIFFYICLFVTIYTACLMKRRVIFNRLEGTLTYFGFLLPWHHTIAFDKVQINAYEKYFKIFVPYRGLPLNIIGKNENPDEAQAWWSFYMWYMDRNRPLPTGTLFTQEEREKDYLRRKAEGFPHPLYAAGIDTPEWEGAESKYQDTEAEQRNQTIYKASERAALDWKSRQIYIANNSFVAK